jgi:argininosuccinate synthase
MAKNNKVVLAYSGGLDTSFCVKHLTVDRGLEVYSAIVNTGGFSKKELKEIEEKAYEMGVTKHTTLDLTDEYYQKCVKYLIFGNCLKNNTYPLSVSAERAFQAFAIVEYANTTDASYIAHGSTGAGNDQVRFDMIFNTMAPNIEVITPIRDLKLSRQAEIEYLAKHGVKKEWAKAKYSINKGLWGTSVGGEETLTSHATLPEEAWPSQLTKTGSEKIEIEFKKGEPVGFNGKLYDKPAKLIEGLNNLASQYAIGRDIHVGDTIIGIKGRVGFEAAAALIIIKAHHLLEKHNLTKWQQHHKEQMGNWYGMLLHEGQYLDPVMRNIETFLQDTQKNITGKVFVQLQPYHFSLIGIESKHDMMKSDLGQYGEMNNGWTADDVKGFTKMVANSNKIYHSVNN